ncbi:hypothetical protein EST38_g9455 [Candolleomyces aberdarensis]|uniref:Uncharacterized protein n=1 Tax=Candolleomyces aberdarensis TaxID=2316362 RepID=A0A4Q2DC72_9AGAR|nr:hypothetical protein EST38_g9455 [Candolleomyces aberdarensis]
MVAIRLLPFATAVFLSVLHTELVTARPLHRESLSLRSLGSEAYDDGALALREPFDEDSLEEYFSREPTATRGEARPPTPPPSPQPSPQPSPPPAPQPANPSRGNKSPATSKGRRSFDEDSFEEYFSRGPTSPAKPGKRDPGSREPSPQPSRPGSPEPARPATPQPPPPPPPQPANKSPAKSKGRRSFDEDSLEEYFSREPVATPGRGKPAPPSPDPNAPGPSRPPSPQPQPAPAPQPQPANPSGGNKSPAKSKGRRSFDEDEFERRAILEEIIEELLRREFFVDMDLD